MIILPTLVAYTKPRPNRPRFTEKCLVPDYENYSLFWKKIRHFLYSLSVYEPLQKNFLGKIDSSSGYFGNRTHPVTMEPQYYHLGVEAEASAREKITPLLKGVLEYSGYSAVNGYYVLLSHPYIQTEDGYILHTMYCHLKKPLVKFSSYQKMLREISLGSHPLIDIDTNVNLGFVCSSEVTIGDKPKLYVQCDFRKFDRSPIVVDPMYFFSERLHTNVPKK